MSPELTILLAIAVVVLAVINVCGIKHNNNFVSGNEDASTNAK